MEQGKETKSPSYAMLTRGDPFPWMAQRSGDGPCRVDYLAAGRYLVLCFFGSANNPLGRDAIEAIQQHRAFFDDQRACLFGISVDPTDEAQGRVRNDLPGVRFLWDFDASVSRGCGAAPTEPSAQGALLHYNQFWLIVDPTLHVLAKFKFGSVPHESVFAYLHSLPAPENFAGFEIPAPVLVLPNVFEPKLCQHLVEQYSQNGGTESTVHRMGVEVHDHAFKRRKDFTIGDEQLRKHIDAIIGRRISPEIAKLFFMKITRMDRYLIGCYDATDGGHFAAHRDNNSKFIAHRRFAVSINLNEDFDGGEVAFPEYNRRGIKAPLGWAVVFPCAILHTVSRVSRGRRYAFLPFLFDEAGVKIFERVREKSSASASVNL